MYNFDINLYINSRYRCEISEFYKGELYRNLVEEGLEYIIIII